jgi:hypothetical protein
MTSDETKLESIFCGAIEVASAADRAEFIAHACGGDEDLARVCVTKALPRSANDSGAVRALDQIERALRVVSDSHGFSAAYK